MSAARAAVIDDEVIDDEVIAILSRRYPAETFRACPGHPGYYISDHGSPWTTWEPWHTSKPTESFTEEGVYLRRPYRTLMADRYPGIAMRCRSRKHFAIHRLVLEAFVGPCPEGMEGCHNDDTPTNNHLSNLRWDSSKRNHADRMRLSHGTRGEANGFAKMTAETAREAVELRRQGLSYKRIGDRFGVYRHTIRDILTGKRWRHLQLDAPIGVPAGNTPGGNG